MADHWALKDFESRNYHLRLYGPNGFYREFRGNNHDPILQIFLEYERTPTGINKLSGNVEVKIKNVSGSESFVCRITDNHYGMKPLVRKIRSGKDLRIRLDLSKNYNWYDFTIEIEGYPDFSKSYAGHVETGSEGYTDPAMET